MEKKIGKKEIILLIILFAALLVIWSACHRTHRETGSFIRVSVSGEILGEYPLVEDREIPVEIGGSVTNTIVIKDGNADMVYADCPDQTCVKTRPISAQRETIVCLPNRVVVEVISSEEETGFDVIAQ